jgi:hypothetical protein
VREIKIVYEEWSYGNKNTKHYTSYAKLIISKREIISVGISSDGVVVPRGNFSGLIEAQGQQSVLK